jgi:hypothetical protein
MRQQIITVVVVIIGLITTILWTNWQSIQTVTTNRAPSLNPHPAVSVLHMLLMAPLMLLRCIRLILLLPTPGHHCHYPPLLLVQFLFRQDFHLFLQ